MIVKISERAVRLIRASTFSSTGDLAMSMHAALGAGAPTTLGAHEALAVEATPEAWQALASWLARNSVVPPGASPSARREAQCLDSAGRRITEALVSLAKHPGYRGVGVAGRDRTLLRGYRSGGERWWPTPAMALANGDGSAVEAATLEPEVVKIGRRHYTVWVNRPGC